MLSLHVQFRDHGMKWPLRDHYDVEVWTSGHVLIATLSGQIIRHLVELHLGSAAVQSEIQAVVRKPTVALADRAILAPQRREALRKQRRSRKGARQ